MKDIIIIYNKEVLINSINKKCICPIYIGIFLNKKSINNVMNKYKPIFKDIFVDHITLKYQPEMTVENIFSFINSNKLNIIFSFENKIDCQLTARLKKFLNFRHRPRNRGKQKKV